MVLQQLKRLARQSAIYGMADSFGPIANLLMMPILTRILTREDYGTLALLSLLGVGAKIVFRMGLDAGFFRIYYDQKTDLERRVFATTILVAGTLISVSLFAVTCVGARWLAEALLRMPVSRLVVLVAADTLLNTFSFIPMSIFRIEGRATYFLVATLLRSGLNIALKVALVALGWGVSGVLWADVLSSAIFILMLSPTLVRHLGAGFSVPMLREALGFGLPKVPHGLAYQALNLADRKILEVYTSLAQVGLYSVAYTFGTGIKLFLSAFELAWSPFVYSLAARADAATTLARIATYVAAVLAALGLAIAVLSRQILAVFTAPPYHAAYPVIPVVMLAYLIQGLFALTSIGIGISKKAYYYPLMTFTAAAVNVGLNLLWIPRYGIMGAAWATVAGYGVMAGMGLAFSQKHYPIPFEWGRLARIALAAALSYGVSLAAPAGAGAALAVKAGVLLGFPVLLFALGFFRRSEIVRLRELERRIHSIMRGVRALRGPHEF